MPVTHAAEHPPAPTILEGDARTVLRSLPAGSVSCCVTSPPYWQLRDYGTPPVVWDGQPDCGHVWRESPRTTPASAILAADLLRPREQGQWCQLCGAWRGQLGLEPTPDLYVAHLVDVLRAVRRVLRDDGTLWLNLGDSYTSGGRSAYDVARMKPRHARPMGKLHGGTTTVDMSTIPRPPLPDGLKPKDLVGIPWRVAFALQQPWLTCRACGTEHHASAWGRWPDGRSVCPSCLRSTGADVTEPGWWLRCDVVWAKPNPMPESVTDRPTRAHEFLFLLAKSQRYFYDAHAISEAATWGQPNSPGSIRSPYGQGFTRRSNSFNRGGVRLRAEGSDEPYVGTEASRRNKRSVWTISTRPYRGAHFAVFPEALVEPCVLAGTSARGCCASCGAPWRRVVERTKHPIRNVAAERTADARTGRLGGRLPGPGGKVDGVRSVGWEPSCGCEVEATHPASVLDPFAGSGTTLAVASRLGRQGIGVELRRDYIGLAEGRCAAVSARAA
jgi:DNA modification methylase